MNVEGHFPQKLPGGPKGIKEIDPLLKHKIARKAKEEGLCQGTPGGGDSNPEEGRVLARTLGSLGEEVGPRWEKKQFNYVSLDRKLLATDYTKELGAELTGYLFGVGDKTVRRWTQMEPELREEKQREGSKLGGSGGGKEMGMNPTPEESSISNRQFMMQAKAALAGKQGRAMAPNAPAGPLSAGGMGVGSAMGGMGGMGGMAPKTSVIPPQAQNHRPRPSIQVPPESMGYFSRPGHNLNSYKGRGVGAGGMGAGNMGNMGGVGNMMQPIPQGTPPPQDLGEISKIRMYLRTIEVSVRKIYELLPNLLTNNNNNNNSSMNTPQDEGDVEQYLREHPEMANNGGQMNGGEYLLKHPELMGSGGNPGMDNMDNMDTNTATGSSNTNTMPLTQLLQGGFYALGPEEPSKGEEGGVSMGVGVGSANNEFEGEEGGQEEPLDDEEEGATNLESPQNPGGDNMTDTIDIPLDDGEY